MPQNEVGVSRQKEILSLCQPFWEKLIQDEDVDPEVRLRASELLVRSAGGFIDGKFHTHHVFQGAGDTGDLTDCLLPSGRPQN